MKKIIFLCFFSLIHFEGILAITKEDLSRIQNNINKNINWFKQRCEEKHTCLPREYFSGFLPEDDSNKLYNEGNDELFNQFSCFNNKITHIAITSHIITKLLQLQEEDFKKKFQTWNMEETQKKLEVATINIRSKMNKSWTIMELFEGILP